MKKPLLDTQKRIVALTSRLESALGLDSWLRITHHFVEGFDGDTEIESDGTVRVYKTVAVTTAQWEYRAAKITWYLSTAVALSEEKLEEVAIHEYVHILIAPITTLVPAKLLTTATKLEEFAVESIMRAIGHALGRENVN